MRVFICLLLASACLVVPGGGRSVPRIEQQVTTEVIDQTLDTDDVNKDPDWVPNYDDEDYHDYDDKDYAEENEDEDEDEGLEMLREKVAQLTLSLYFLLEEGGSQAYTPTLHEVQEVIQEFELNQQELSVALHKLEQLKQLEELKQLEADSQENEMVGYETHTSHSQESVAGQTVPEVDVLPPAQEAVRTRRSLPPWVTQGQVTVPEQLTHPEDTINDNTDEDPDWTPEEKDYDDMDTYSDDEDYDNEYSYSGDEHEYSYSGDEADDEDEDEDELWSSDDDPDWVPTEKQRYELMVDEVARRLTSSPHLLPHQGQQAHTHTPSLQAVKDSIHELDLGLDELTVVLSQLHQITQLEIADIYGDLSRENELASQKDSSQEDELVSQNDLGQTVPEVHAQHTAFYSKRVKKSASASWPGQVSQGQVAAGQFTQEEDAINGYGTWEQNQDIEQIPHQSQDHHHHHHHSQGVAEGVEPLAGPQQHDVGTGVEPAGGTEDEKPSFIGWLQSGWGKLSGAVDTLGDQAGEKVNQWGDQAGEKLNQWGDKAEEKLDQLGENLGDVVQTVHHAVSHAAGKVKDTAQSVRNGAVGVYKGVVSVFAKFGTLVQEGARYCIARLSHTLDRVRGSELLDKLKRKLAEGDAQVAKFFQLLGQKINAWRDIHPGQNVDMGLVEGVPEGEGGHHGNTEQVMPDFFQEDDVILQLKKLVEVGVLTPEDLELLSQEHHDQKQSQQYGQQSQQHGQQSQQGQIHILK